MTSTNKCTFRKTHSTELHGRCVKYTGIIKNLIFLLVTSLYQQESHHVKKLAGSSLKAYYLYIYTKKKFFCQRTLGVNWPTHMCGPTVTDIEYFAAKLG